MDVSVWLRWSHGDCGAVLCVQAAAEAGGGVCERAAGRTEVPDGGLVGPVGASLLGEIPGCGSVGDGDVLLWVCVESPAPCDSASPDQLWIYSAPPAPPASAGSPSTCG